MSPDISIMLVYNSGEYLNKSINSSLNQTYQNIDIICINYGAVDNLLNILNDFAKTDKRVVVIDQENNGPAVARNKGLAATDGKYIMFCDSDDWYEPIMC